MCIQELCVAVSILLHYFYLAAFCLMLAEAIQLLLSTVFVFHVQTTAQTAGLIIAAWSKSFLSFIYAYLTVQANLGYNTNPYYRHCRIFHWNNKQYIVRILLSFCRSMWKRSDRSDALWAVWSCHFKRSVKIFDLTSTLNAHAWRQMATKINRV